MHRAFYLHIMQQPVGQAEGLLYRDRSGADAAIRTKTHGHIKLSCYKI